MQYVEKRVKEAEDNQLSIPRTSRGNTATTGTGSAAPKGYAKTLAKPKPRPTKIIYKENDAPVEEEEIEDWSDLEVIQHEDTRADVAVLQTRMLNLENMLQEVIQHLSQRPTQQ